MILMRILIYGAGVIGSLYAALFAEAGYDTSIYARGKRFEALRNNILDAALTPRLIQPTTFAEISGNKSERTKQFSEILRHAHIPYQEVTDMHLWQLCHLAMVVPIADAYYESDDPEKVEKEWKIMRKTAERLKRNFNFLRKQKGKLSPWKMNIFRFLPLSFLTIMLAVTFGSSFGDKFMYQHAMKAPDEMRELHKQFYAYMKRMKKCGCKAKRYSDWRKKHEK